MDYNNRRFQRRAPQFDELHRVTLERNLDLVFSRRRSDGRISIAQQAFSEMQGGRRFSTWIKNAIIVDFHGLEEALNAFQEVFDMLLEENQNDKKANETKLPAS
jgi:hypothetical protein